MGLFWGEAKRQQAEKDLSDSFCQFWENDNLISRDAL
jgi:hypothetical protein